MARTMDRHDSGRLTLEVRAVGPFFKNGFRRRVSRDPRGDPHRSRRRSRRTSWHVAKARQLVDSPHPADARPRGSHHGCRRPPSARSACRSTCTVTICFFTTTPSRWARCSACASSSRRRWTFSTRPAQAIAFGSARGAVAPHAGTLPGRRLPRSRQGRQLAAPTCSSATRCLPARLAGPIYPAAIRRRCSRRSGTSCFPSATTPGSTRAMDRPRPSARNAEPTRI